MPIRHAIWRVGDQPASLVRSRLASEQQLEAMIVREPCILSSEWMPIGRQEITVHGGRIDLLAISPDGSLVLIEIERDRTPREIVAQALDYASRVADLTAAASCRSMAGSARGAASRPTSAAASASISTRRR